MKKRFIVLSMLFFCVFYSAYSDTASVKTIEKFYSEYVSNDLIPSESLLGKKEEPTVFYDNEGYTLDELRQNNYLEVVGASGWSQGNEVYKLFQKANKSQHKKIIEFAKKHEQKYVFVETVRGEKSSYTYYTTTTTNSASSSAGTYSFNSSGSTTTTTTPTTVTKQKVSYFIYLLRPFTKEEMSKWKIGAAGRDLTSDEQKNLNRNTGYYVEAVYRKYPAFYAEIRRGDIIIQMDGTKIRTNDDLVEFGSKLQKGDVVKVLLLRDGVEKTVDMEI